MRSEKIVNLFDFASFINFFYSCNYLLACACLHYIWMTEYAFFNLVNVWFKNNENFDNGGFAISREVLSKHINITSIPSSLILLLFMFSLLVSFVLKDITAQNCYMILKKNRSFKRSFCLICILLICKTETWFFCMGRGRWQC